jgi:transposase-like protein
MFKQEQIEAARELYLNNNISQAEIAQQLGIGERTLSRWVSEGQWRKLKKAARYMPANIVDNFQAQIIEMQESIMSRPKGQRFATEHEAAIMSRLVLSVSRMKVEVSRSRSAQVLMNFIDLVYARAPQLAVEITKIGHEFLKGPSKNGFHPWDFEYDPGIYNDDDLADHAEPTLPRQESPENIQSTHSSHSPHSSHSTQPLPESPGTGGRAPKDAISQNPSKPAPVAPPGDFSAPKHAKKHTDNFPPNETPNNRDEFMSMQLKNNINDASKTIPAQNPPNLSAPNKMSPLGGGQGEDDKNTVSTFNNSQREPTNKIEQRKIIDDFIESMRFSIDADKRRRNNGW